MTHIVSSLALVLAVTGLVAADVQPAPAPTPAATPVDIAAEHPLSKPRHANKDSEPTNELGHSRRPFNIAAVPDDMRAMFAELDAAMKTIKKKYKFEDEECGSCDQSNGAAASGEPAIPGPETPPGGLAANPADPMSPRLFVPAQQVVTVPIVRRANNASLGELKEAMVRLTKSGQDIVALHQIDLADDAALVVIITTQTRLTPLPTIDDINRMRLVTPVSSAAPPPKPWSGPTGQPATPSLTAPTPPTTPELRRPAR